MGVRKAWAIAVAGGILGLQVFASAPHTTGDWYWPFINYPMYSESKQVGDSFTYWELRVAPCAGDGAAVPLGGRPLHITWFRFSRMLEAVAGTSYGKPIPPEESERTMAALAQTITRHDPVTWCRAGVWKRTFTLGTTGVVDPSVPWRLVREWSLSAASVP